MKRRVFIGLVGATGAWPLAVRAEQSGTPPTIGFLGPTTASLASQRTAVFVQRLRELGWIVGQNVAIEYRWAEGRTERFGNRAAELVRLKVDVIATWGTETAVAARQATSVTPIVFTVVGDPVGSGLATSLARPGGNITGLSTQHHDSAGKRLELLREAVPQLRHLALMANIATSGDVLETNAVLAAARPLGLEITQLKIRQAEEITPAMEGIKGRVEATTVIASTI